MQSILTPSDWTYLRALVATRLAASRNSISVMGGMAMVPLESSGLVGLLGRIDAQIASDADPQSEVAAAISDHPDDVIIGGRGDGPVDLGEMPPSMGSTETTV